MGTPPPVDWGVDDADVDTIRHALAGAAVGSTLLALVAVATLVRSADPETLLILAVALLVAVATGRALAGVRTVDVGGSLRRRPLLLAGVAWAIGLALVWRWRPLAAVALLVVAVGGWILTMACRTEGRLDPDEGSLRYGTRTAPLDAVSEARRIPLGPVAAYWLRFERGAVGSGVPRVLVVPRAVDAAVGRALTNAASADAPAGDGHHEAGRVERGVAAALGLGCLLAGPVLWLLLPSGGDATLVTLYLTAIGAPFGVIMLRYALVA
ncbi:hypothetical protein [Haloplanus sp. C73]|uniref:hypothetical protein n=1 Tax=Haloplanus sp. C73 TaxID=3421641 RepID=UPI003EBBBEF9